jgi:hypothetical protein
MGLRVYDNNTWNQARALRVYNGSSWSNATRSWIYNGSSWSINYPENPVFTTSPSISYVSSAQPIPGNGLSVNTGSVNTDPAFAPASYSYQWTRNGSSISGANSNLYYLTTSDLGTTVTCLVTATNNRGSTPISATGGVFVIPAAPTGLTITDNTVTPNQPSFVSVTTSANSWSASWGASSPLSYYSVSSSNGVPNNSSPTGTSTSSSSASPGGVTVYVSAVNNSTTARISWSAVPGATSYDVSHSFGSVNTTSTFVDITNQYGTLNATVTSKYGSSSGYSASANGSISSRQSGTATGSGTVPSPPGTPSVSAGSITENSINFSWGATSNTDYYRVYIGTSPGSSNIVNTTTYSTSYNATGLSSSTPYYATITAYSSSYGYGNDGTASGTTTQSSAYTVYAPYVQFERTSTQIKWGIDNGSFSGAFSPFGIEWEVRTSPGGGTLITSGNTINYTTSYNRGPVNGFYWNYWVRSTTDLPYSSSARYLRARMYGQNSVTYSFIDGPWSSWI